MRAEERIDIRVRQLQRSVMACGLQHVQLPIWPPLQCMVDGVSSSPGPWWPLLTLPLAVIAVDGRRPDACHRCTPSVTDPGVLGER